MKLSDGAYRGRLDRIRNRYDSQKLSPTGKQKGSFSLLRQIRHSLLLHFRQRNPLILHKSPVARKIPLPIADSRNASAENRLKIRDVGNPLPRLFRFI